MPDFLSEEAELALSGSGQALMKLFPPQYDPSYFNHGDSDSNSSICVNQMVPSVSVLNDPWMPVMASTYGQTSSVVGWNGSFPTFPDSKNNLHYKHHSNPQYNHSPPIVSSSKAPENLLDIATPSLATKPIQNSPSASPTSTKSFDYGYRNAEGFLVCSFRGCTSRAVFSRGCDLRKHYKRHNKSLFCSFESCPQHYEGGFSSKKDLARHEAKHNPGVWCEWEGCDRLFSRVDNMRDHLRRIHLKDRKGAATTSSFPESSSRSNQSALNRTRSAGKRG